MLETVLFSDKYRSLIPLVRRTGLIFRLVYITTVHPDINVARVRRRVLAGGHDVPEDKIHERWTRSMDNLAGFAERADRLIVVDNSGQEPVMLALRHLEGALEIHDVDHPASDRLRSLRNTVRLP
ncbi:hypothetical protein [Chondromyces apiculatus]|uniref:Zeta toxin domain-containing protein n=1 Tax=Chondromyces apiculatus DSM 436 TaxID=1192034 RepID=A0A017SU14_9BACT|nr:hypothetical protein [Chondromyces apiculatus]EYF00060.1 Hypothetical protein CAP_1411 [Chondromyces apiculatus DSM 436]